ncbi:hypothetical protein BH11MYX2_BH11MYX2_22910 [soil metagenome]
MTARAAVLALALLGGCELIADIPSSSSSTHSDDAGGGGDDVIGDDSGGSSGDADSSMLECTVNPDCTTAAKPTCSADHVCRACQIDTDCGTTGVCMLDGTCAAAARIMYVSPTGTGAACSTAAPCALDQAVSLIAAGRDVIKLAPTMYDRTTTLAVAPAVPVLIAGEGATIRNLVSAMFGFTWTSNGDVTFTGVTFDHNAKFGSECLGGKLTLSRVTMRSALLAFFAAAACDVTAERTVWTGNQLYSISIPDGVSTLHIRNSLFANNGTTDNTISQIFLQDAGLVGEIENTTIANNLSDTQPSINCTGPFTVRNVISFGNTAPPSAACAVSYSDVEAGFGGANNHNVTLGPAFVGATDYHLQATSPVRGIGDPANVLPLDYDFQPRPQPAGSAPDLGFDEVP